MSVGCLPKRLLLLCLILLVGITANSQDSSSVFDRILSFPDKVFRRVDKETSRFEQKLTQQTNKYLNRLQKKEEKLKRKLWSKDSLKAKEIFGDVEGRYNALRNNFNNQTQDAQEYSSSVYIGRLDSMGTALNFLQKNPQLQQATGLASKLNRNLEGISELKNKLNQTENLRNYLQDRQQELSSKLQNTGLAKEFRNFKKEVYYYQAQVRTYQDAIKDPKKLGNKLLEMANKIPAFDQFFRRHSELASLFRIPGGISEPGSSTASFAGLQTRVEVQDALQQRIGAGPNAPQYVQQQMQGAQEQIHELKNKLQQYKTGSYGNGEGEMPDFKVNNQRTRSFFQRIEWGSNIQTSKGNFYFPITSDIGLSAGYKLNEKSVIGIGASYKIGFGQNWQHIKVTQQGAGLRTFVDIKLKGSFWVSGGGEMNYRTEFRRIEILKEMSAWQQSALLGISKKIKVGKKLNGNSQVLYDFLWKQQVPRTQAVVFRVGYYF